MEESLGCQNPSNHIHNHYLELVATAAPGSGDWGSRTCFGHRQPAHTVRIRGVDCDIWKRVEVPAWKAGSWAISGACRRPGPPLRPHAAERVKVNPPEQVSLGWLYTQTPTHPALNILHLDNFASRFTNDRGFIRYRENKR